MSYTIVVARYNENIDWLLPEMKNCIIFNKGKPIGLTNEISLPNVGREADTYLNYIIQYYNAFPDVVVFTQGNISDHHKEGLAYLLQIKDDALTRDKSFASYGYKSSGFSWLQPDFEMF